MKLPYLLRRRPRVEHVVKLKDVYLWKGTASDLYVVARGR